MTDEQPKSDLPIARDQWPPGPWHDEPDSVEWLTEAGLLGHVLRSDVTGALCGYVAVPPGHPAYARPIRDIDVTVHGGLTFGEFGWAMDVAARKPPGDPDLYWVGFDCGHAFDVKPGLEGLFALKLSQAEREERARIASFETYRTVDYVRGQVESLARQLGAMAGAGPNAEGAP